MIFVNKYDVNCGAQITNYRFLGKLRTYDITVLGSKVHGSFLYAERT